MTHGPNNKRLSGDAEDANATVPAKGWNDAATIPAGRPASGSAVNLDQTVPANLNRPLADADTLPTRPMADPDRTLPSELNVGVGGSDTNATRPTQLGDEATLLAGSASGVPSDPAVLLQTRATGGGNGSSTPMSSSALSSSSSGALSRSFTRTGRTRVNLNLPAEAQQLDQKLQLSRSSVLSDMATARIGKGDLPPGITKLIEQQGTEGRYAIERPLAAGGMGAVLHINDHDFRRPAAMKVILSRYAQNPEATERFLAEAQVTAQLEHPNIVPIHDLGVMEDGTLYFTMKLIEGMSLGRVVKLLQQQTGTLKDKEGNLVPPDADSAAAAKKWTDEEKLLTFLKVLDGVGFAHSRGVVHRDLKPDNVMLGTFGEVLVVDWGIAKILGTADPQHELVRKVASLRDQQSASMTMDGSAMGTLYYMPPEQAMGNLSEVDARSDVYALGATLYELLALRRCLDSGNMADMIARIASGAYNRLDAVAPHLSLDLVAIVHKAMATQRADRYQSCADFSADIRRYLAGQAVHARRRNIIELIGLWYAAHRRQVQVAAAGVVLVVVAVATTVAVIKQGDRAKVQTLLAQAKQDYDAGRIVLDLPPLERAQVAIAQALILDRFNPQAIELKALNELAIDNAKREAEDKVQREAAAKRAQALTAEAKQLRASGNPEEAEKALDAALKLAPSDEAIIALMKEVAGDLTNKREVEARKAGKRAREEGDALLAKADQLDRADTQVDVLLRQAEDKFAQAESVVPIDGTQAQVKKVALLRQAAESARKAKDDQIKGEAAATSAKAALEARQFAKAKDAVAQALGFIPNRADLVALRDRILVEENAALTAEERAKRQTQADALSSKAATALAAGDLAAAREAAAQAWGLVPGHPATEQVRAKIATAERQAAEFARLTELRTKATASLADAKRHQAALQAANRAHAQAVAMVTDLSQRLNDKASTEKTSLWEAHRREKAAITQVSESWSLTEAAAQSVLTFLAEDREHPVVAEAKRILADLYQARLVDARRRRDVGNVAAFANLLSRYDDGQFANLLKDFGRLTVTGPAGTELQISEVDAGTDLRLVPMGKPMSVKLPTEPLVLKGGRYQITGGDLLMTLEVNAVAAVELTWPGKMPSIPGMPLRYVPPMQGRKAFLLAEREVLSREYDRFLHDPAVWKRAVASWKEFYTNGGGDAAAFRLIPRQIATTYWQAVASDDHILTSLTMPKAEADMPVAGVSRDDALDFCAWLSKQHGLKVRLPSRAEWQSAADGGDALRAYPWGEVFDYGFTAGIWAPDGSKRDGPIAPASVAGDVGPFGHRDLAGNLSEWVSDTGSARGAEVVGGSWSEDRPDQFRVTQYQTADPFFTNPTIGFRILVELP